MLEENVCIYSENSIDVRREQRNSHVQTETDVMSSQASAGDLLALVTGTDVQSPSVTVHHK